VPSQGRIGIDGTSGKQLREDESGEQALATLFDPARLIRGIGAVVGARPGRRIGRDCVEMEVEPHRLFADPAGYWLPGDARSLRVAVDTATGFLLAAELRAHDGSVISWHLDELRADAVPPTGPCAVRDGRLNAPSSAHDQAGYVPARMAATLLEPVRLTAGVTIERDSHRDLSPSHLGAPSGRRSWDVTVAGPDGGSEQFAMTGDYRPDRTGPAAARLAELLSPARIVSHLQEVTPTGPASLSATIRPMRTFPFSAWAPDDGLACGFTVDPATGVLVRAELRAPEAERPVACHVVNSLEETIAPNGAGA
jgi:hypothetical protein